MLVQFLIILRLCPLSLEDTLVQFLVKVFSSMQNKVRSKRFDVGNVNNSEALSLRNIVVGLM